MFSVRIFFVNLDQIQSMAILKISGLNDLGKMMRGEGKDNDDDDDGDGDDGDGDDDDSLGESHGDGDDDDDDDDCVGERLRIKPLRRFVCRGHWYGPASSQAGGGTLH